MQKEENLAAQSPQQLLETYSAEVKVSEPEANSGKGYYTYLISGRDQLGEFQIRRRYNDFFYFRQALQKRWPAIFIPPIPEKKIAGNKDADNIEIRKKFFDFFMKRIAKLKHLFTSPITQDFIRNKGIDMEKFCSSMASPKYQELVPEYRAIYSKVDLDQKNTHNIKAGIQGFWAFLKKASKQLEDLRDKVETIVDARAGFTSNLNNCTQTLLPEYEKNIYSEYLPEEEKQTPNLVFVHNMKVIANCTLLKEASTANSFAGCLDHLNYEILEVKAMEQALKSKEKCEGELKSKREELGERQGELEKLTSGKTTLKSFFSRGSKTDQIQKLQLAIPELQKEIGELQRFSEMATIIWGCVEVPVFKRNKQLQYYRMMYEISENEMKYMNAYGEFMKSILQGLTK